MIISEIILDYMHNIQLMTVSKISSSYIHNPQLCCKSFQIKCKNSNSAVQGETLQTIGRHLASRLLCFFFLWGLCFWCCSLFLSLLKLFQFLCMVFAIFFLFSLSSLLSWACVFPSKHAGCYYRGEILVTDIVTL